MEYYHKTEDGTYGEVPSASLCLAVHLLTTFLDNKGYGDVFGQTSEARVSVFNNTLGAVSEEDPVQVDDFGFSGLLCLGIVT